MTGNHGYAHISRLSAPPATTRASAGVVPGTGDAAGASQVVGGGLVHRPGHGAATVNGAGPHG
jgi:hypothetical protein